MDSHGTRTPYMFHSVNTTYWSSILCPFFYNSTWLSKGFLVENSAYNQIITFHEHRRETKYTNEMKQRLAKSCKSCRVDEFLIYCFGELLFCVYLKHSEDDCEQLLTSDLCLHPSGDQEADAGEERQLQERHQDHHHQEVRRSHLLTASHYP